MRFYFEDMKKGMKMDVEGMSVSEIKQLICIGLDLHKKGVIEPDFEENKTKGDIKHAILTILMDGEKDLSDLQYAIFSRRVDPSEPEYTMLANALYSLKKKGLIEKLKGKFWLSSVSRAENKDMDKEIDDDDNNE